MPQHIAGNMNTIYQLKQIDNNDDDKTLTISNAIETSIKTVDKI